MLVLLLVVFMLLTGGLYALTAPTEQKIQGLFLGFSAACAGGLLSLVVKHTISGPTILLITTIVALECFFLLLNLLHRVPSGK